MIRNPSGPLLRIQYSLQAPFDDSLRHSVPRRKTFTMLSSTLFALVGLLCSLQIAFAAPDPSQISGQSIPLVRRQLAARTIEDWGAWAQNEREALRVKYGGAPSLKRSEGTNLSGLPLGLLHTLTFVS